MHDWGVNTAIVSTLDYIAAPGMEREAFAPGETEKIEIARAALHNARAEAARMGLALQYSLPGPTGGNHCNERIDRCLYVDAEGRLSPCIYVNLPTTGPDPCRRVYGNALESNPLHIWHGEGFTAFRRALASGNPDTPCVRCAKRFERTD